MKYYYFVFILFSLSFHSQHYTSYWYGMDDGLPQNSIKDIIKDKYGFIWLSTDGGIIRYDGKSFLLYNSFKTGNLSFGSFLETKNKDIICFNSNDENCVLVSNRTAKIFNEKVPKTYFMANNKQYKRYYKSSFISNWFPETNTYYINTDSGIYYFDNHCITYKQENKPAKKILSGFPMKGLGSAFEHNNTIYLPDPKNRKTIILKNGVISYDHKPSLYNDPKSKIFWHQGTKQVFVINNSNIYLSKLSHGSPSLSFLMQYEKIEKELLYCIFHDEESDKLYFGNVVKGLNIINLSQFYIPQKNIPFSGEVVYEALPFTSNSIISKQGFEYYRDKVNKIYSATFNYDKRYLVYDNSRNLLYVEFNKIHRRYSSSQYKKHDSIMFFNRNVEGLFKIKSNLAVNMADNKYEYYYLHIFSDDQFKKHTNTFRFKNNITSIQEGDNSTIYVGTTNGIFIISLSENKIMKYLAKDLSIKGIQRTKDGNYWFTTHNKGFYLINKNKIIRMLQDQEGYIANAHHILEDNNGFLWISSNNGLFKVSEKSLLDYSKNKKNRVTYYRYTKEDGFLNNEFNGSANPSGNILKNGDFIFPSMEGFVFFKPNEIKTHYPKKDQLFIERAKVGKKMINFTDTLRLKSNYKMAEIFLDFPYYHDIKNIYAEAKLENSENSNWEGMETSKKFILNDNPPGNYILHIRFLTSEKGQFAYRKICIEIEPFFYQTIGFRILIILLGILFIVLIIRMRTNILKKTVKVLKDHLDNKDQELEITANKLKNESEYQKKIMESITHDITTPIRFLVSISQRLNNTSEAELQKKYFDEIYHTSEQLFKFTLDLKEYTGLFKEENIFMGEEQYIYTLVEDKKKLFGPIAAANQSIIRNLCNPDLTTRINKNILSAILHNLIDNAVKNTIKGEILIKTEQKNGEVEIIILDTGKGMSSSQIEYYSQVFENMEKEDFIFKNYGLGLHMVIQLTKKINAGIRFSKNEPTGTIVKVIINGIYE